MTNLRKDNHDGFLDPKFVFGKSREKIEFVLAIVVALCTLIATIVAIFTLDSHQPDWLDSLIKSGNKVNFGIHLIFTLTVVLLGTPTVKKPNIKGLAKKSSGLKKDLKKLGLKNSLDLQNQIAYGTHSINTYFIRYWTGIWVSWFVLYSFLLIIETSGLNWHGEKFFLPLVCDIVNNVGSYFILLCFLTLTYPTDRSNSENFHWQKNRWGIFLLIITIIELAVKLAFYFKAFDKSGYPAVSVYLDSANSMFTIFSGVLAGTSMALFIGRIDSKYIHNRIIILVVLYLYAAIQPLYSEVWPDKFPAVKLAVLYVALLGKAVLFVFVSSLFRNNRLLFYFIMVRQLHLNVNKEWKSFNALLSEEKTEFNEN